MKTIYIIQKGYGYGGITTNVFSVEDESFAKDIVKALTLLITEAERVWKLFSPIREQWHKDNPFHHPQKIEDNAKRNQQYVEFNQKFYEDNFKCPAGINETIFELINTYFKIEQDFHSYPDWTAEYEEINLIVD